MSVGWNMAASSAPPHPCRDAVRFGTGAGAVDPAGLARIGRALRTRVIDVFAEAGVELPERRIWAVADYPQDCEQLVVAFVSMAEDRLPRQEASIPSPCEISVQATFVVTITRCIPLPDDSGELPTTEAIDVSTDQLATDAYMLMKAACRFDMFGADLVGLDPSALGGMGVVPSVTAQSAQGGLQSTVLTLTTVIG